MVFSRVLGPAELVGPLLSLSALSTSILSGSTTPATTLSPAEVEPFLQDIARRFEPDNEIDGVLGDVVKHLVWHESLSRPEGLGGSDTSWRGVIAGLEALVSIKSIAMMITRMGEWIPADATAASIEHSSLLGPLCRLGVFTREWVCSLHLRRLGNDVDRCDSLESVKRISRTRKGLLGVMYKVHTLACVGL